MEKRKRITGNDTDKALTKAGSSKPGRLKPGQVKPGKLKTEQPLAEKDEVKQAEEDMRIRASTSQKKT